MYLLPRVGSPNHTAHDHEGPFLTSRLEFHRTTQYGMNYVLGRNCRFLQGPKTNPFSVKRIREKVLAGEEHYETFLNYRRDGSPFMYVLFFSSHPNFNVLVSFFFFLKKKTPPKKP